MNNRPMTPTSRHREKAAELTKRLAAVAYPSMAPDAAFFDDAPRLIAQALASTHTEGRREMREEAALLCDSSAQLNASHAVAHGRNKRHDLESKFHDHADTYRDTAKRIRALPDAKETR